MPKVSMAIDGTAFCSAMLPVRNTSIIAANGPMALAMSLAPWLKAKPQAVNTCIQENIWKVDLPKSLRFRFLANTNVPIHTAAPIMKMVRKLLTLLMPSCKFFNPLKISMAEISIPPIEAINGTHECRAL